MVAIFFGVGLIPADPEEAVVVLVELSVVEQRYQAVLEVLDDGATVTDVAPPPRVARQTVHVWLRRYACDGLGGLAEHSSKPLVCPHVVISARQFGDLTKTELDVSVRLTLLNPHRVDPLEQGRTLIDVEHRGCPRLQTRPRKVDRSDSRSST